MDTLIIVIELKYGKHDSLTQVPKRFSLLTGLHVARLLESEVTKLMCRNANDNIMFLAILVHFHTINCMLWS